MIRRIARVIATFLLVASSFTQTAHAWDTPQVHAVVTVWPLLDMTAPDPMKPSDTPNMIGFNPTESADVEVIVAALVLRVGVDRLAGGRPQSVDLLGLRRLHAFAPLRGSGGIGR